VLKEDVRTMADKSVDALHFCLTDGMERAMNKFNTAED